MSDTVFIWDTMPLRQLDGTVVSVNGWSVIVTLTADRHPDDPQYLGANGRYDIKRDWEDRHGRARMCYWYSRTGRTGSSVAGSWPKACHPPPASGRAHRYC